MIYDEQTPRTSYADGCSPCLSSHDGELHRVHRAANQTGPAEVHAIQNPREKFSPGHVLAASLRNRLPPGQQTYGRGGSYAREYAWIKRKLISLTHGVFFFPWFVFMKSHSSGKAFFPLTLSHLNFPISLPSMPIKHFIIKKTQGAAE